MSDRFNPSYFALSDSDENPFQQVILDDVTSQELLSYSNSFFLPDDGHNSIPPPVLTIDEVQNNEINQSSLVSQPLHTPQTPDEDLLSSVVKNESVEPLHSNENSMNLAAFQDAQNMRNFSSVQSCISASPLMVLSILPRPGRFNFQAKIPFRDEGFGVKPKWNFSEKQSKLYVAKMTTFPISISTSHHIPGATIVVCPIFTKSCHRFIGVIRCHNCLVRDPNPDAKEHVIQIENKGSQYFTDDHRHMVSVPLPQPAPGEDEVILYTKVGCNTSCPGGPNRRPFGILLRLVVGDEEFGRQFIDLKCCEGPARDMKKEEKQSDMEFINYGPSVQSTSTEMQMAEIVENISNKRRLKQDQKSTNKKQRLESFFKKEECEYLLIPKIFTKETKKFLNYLYDKKFVKSTETVFTESDSTA